MRSAYRSAPDFGVLILDQHARHLTQHLIARLVTVPIVEPARRGHDPLQQHREIALARERDCDVDEWRQDVGCAAPLVLGEPAVPGGSRGHRLRQDACLGVNT
jgi:hypothetical protein